MSPEKNFEISLAPRFYATIVSLDDQRVDPIFTPIGGLTIGARHLRFPQWDLTVTGLYGKGDSDFEELDRSGRGDATFVRTDIEALLRYRFPETSLYAYAGPRYIRGRVSLDHGTMNVWERYVTHFYMAEIGGGFVHALDEAGRHSVFANVTGGVGHSRSTARGNNPFAEVYNTDSVAFLGDINLGYQYAISNFFSISGRYRLINVHFDNEKQHNISRSIVQGVELAGTFRF